MLALLWTTSFPYFTIVDVRLDFSALRSAGEKRDVDGKNEQERLVQRPRGDFQRISHHFIINFVCSDFPPRHTRNASVLR